MTTFLKKISNLRTFFSDRLSCVISYYLKEGDLLLYILAHLRGMISCQTPSRMIYSRFSQNQTFFICFAQVLPTSSFWKKLWTFFTLTTKFQKKVANSSKLSKIYYYPLANVSLEEEKRFGPFRKGIFRGRLVIFF